MKTISLAIIVSQFNSEITDALLAGALERLKELKFPSKKIKIYKVPGAVEIPFMAQHLARKKSFSAIVCLGAVIRGETDHYDYVCQQVSYGCQRVMLDHHIPIIFGILTTKNFKQARDRIGGKHGHKGKEAIDAAMAMISI